MLSPISAFFTPASVALVGASEKPGKVGHAILSNLVFGQVGGTDRACGFQGRLYPVNPAGGEMFGLKTYARVAEIPDTVDYAVIAVAPAFIPDVIEECGAKGVKAISVITGGFGELGAEGKAMQDELVRRARKYGARLLGPNTLGVMSTPARLNASFARTSPPAGAIGLLSQSGALITGMIEYAFSEGGGFSHIVSIGDKADVDDVDILRYFATDPATRVIAVYIESLRDGRRFFETVREIVPHKPVVVFKSGATEGGAKAASSHTGSLAGNDAAYDAAFRQAGVYRATTVATLMDATLALACQPPAAGPRIAILTNAGGPGVIAADQVSRLGLELASLSTATHERLNRVLPPIWSRNNPVDIVGDADPDRYEHSLQALLEAPEVDGVVILLTPQAMTDPLESAHRFVRAATGSAKPVTASFLGIVQAESEDYMDAHGIPERPFPERAVTSMHALVHRGAVTAALRERAPAAAPALSAAARQYLDALRANGRTRLNLAEARAAFELFGLPMNRSALARSSEEAGRAAAQVGFPVAMKIVSEQVLHKSESGGIRLGVRDAAEAERAYREICESVRARVPAAKIDGVSVDGMVSGPELIVGATTDPLFGKLVMFGVGGIFVEVYQDVAFRLAPFTRQDAHAMMREIRGGKILDGARGGPAADRERLADLLVRVGNLVAEYPGIAELDVNPLVITAQGLLAIDARLILLGEPPR